MTVRCFSCMAEHKTQYDVCPYCGYTLEQTRQESLNLMPGTYLQDRFLIGRSLGRGGFSITYIGWDESLQKKVAIKEFLPSELATRAPGETCISILGGYREEQFQRGLVSFYEEAVRLARFEEHGIVDIYDCVYENNTAYIIMELLEGHTVKQLLQANGVMTLPQVLNILEPVLKSLSTVHQEGMLHRDIAPDNIFVTTDGEVKLIDFGASRYASASHSKSLTVLFKEGYTPEEQYHKRGNQGPWSDVYAMAATAYKMLTGITPPRSIDRITKDTLQEPSSLGAVLPDYAENAILNALNILPENRTQSALDFLDELTSEVTLRKNETIINPKNKLPKWMKIAGGIAAGLVVVLVALVATARAVGWNINLGGGLQTPDGKVRVPDVLLKRQSEAEELVTQASLLLKIKDTIEDDNIPRDMILTQTPFPDFVANIGEIVFVVFSAGAREEFVPDFTEFSEELAIEELEKLGFTVKITRKPSDAAPGSVIGTNPTPGTAVPIGSEIELIISLGPEGIDTSKTVDLPDLVGMQVNDAKALLNKSSLYLSISKQTYDSSIPNDQIISQSPAKGAVVNAGDAIKVVVNRKSKDVFVPDVTYRTIENATQRLAAYGLKASYEYKENPNVAEGTVFTQSPKAGAAASSGDTIKLTVSSGVSITAPQLIGLTINEAESKILRAGLYLGSTSVEKSDKPKDTVLKQNPAAGNKVQEGSSVSLVISGGNGTITTVAPVISYIQIENLPNKREYDIGEPLNTSGIRVHAYYTDGNSQNVTSSVSYSGFSSSSAGTKTVTVAYSTGTLSSLKTTFTVSVRAGIVPTTTTRVSTTTTANSTIFSTTNATTTTTTYSTTTTATSTTTRQTVPNVVGLSESSAINAISSRGLSVSVVREYNETMANGNVIRQNPASGTTVNTGSTVTITVSRGREPTTTTTTTTTSTTTTTTTTRPPAIKITAFKVEKAWEDQSAQSQFRVKFTTNVDCKKANISVEGTMRKAATDIFLGKYSDGFYGNAFDRTYFIDASNVVKIVVEDAYGNTDTYTETINLGTPDIAFSSSSISMSLHSDRQITANLLNGVVSHNVIWESSNDNVVSVSGERELVRLTSTRTLTANSPGTATITVKFGSTSYGYPISKSFIVTVT